MIGLGANSTLGIGVLIELKDGFTSTSKRVNTEMEKMHARAKAIMRDNLHDMGNLGTRMMAVGGGIAYGLNSAVKAASEFNLTMTKVKALGGIDGPQTKVLSNLAKSLGERYGLMPQEIATGILELVKRGVDGNEIPKTLDALIMTAIGADERLGGHEGVAARAMDMAMAWGYRAQDMSKIGDMMAKGAQLTSMNFVDLAESMKYSQDVLKSLNLSFAEGVAMIGLLSNAGIKGSVAGTSLTNFYTQMTIALTGASKKKNNALATLGLRPEDFIKANGDMLGLIDTLKILDKALRPFGGVAKQGLLNDLFGIRGKRGENPLVDSLRGDGKLGMGIEELLKRIEKSEGTNRAIYNQLAETYAMRRKRFAATWETFKINVGTALLPALTGLLKALTPIISLIGSFANTTVGKILISIIGAGSIVTFLFGGFLFMISRIGLGFLNWKSTLEQIKTTMGWVMGGMRGKMVATIPGQNINNQGSVYDKNGMLINAASMAAMNGMTPLGWAHRMRRGGAMTRIGRGSASVAGLARAARMRGGLFSKIVSGMIKFSGPVINMFAGLARVLGPVLGLFGRLIPIVGWIWTAWSIGSALFGKSSDSTSVTEAPPEKYNYKMAYENKYGGYHYVPTTKENRIINQVDVTVKPSNVNVNVDGQKIGQEKMNWQAEQSVSDQGLNK